MSDRPSGASDYNTKIIEEFRANQGRVDAEFLEGAPVILIHHIGAKSGIGRVTPVACSPQGDGRFAVWAANGGSPAHPAWYHNLKAHPRITVEVGTPDVPSSGRGVARHRPRSAVAEAGRAVPFPRRSPGQHQAAVSGVHADPPGLTRDENPACATWY